MHIIGLTGSIGMGKTTTAAMFAAHGIPVHSSDQAVHALYSGEAAPLIENAFPGTVIDGHVDRKLLAERVLDDDEALRTLENIVHPLVRRDEAEFLERERSKGSKMALLDIPLLFESTDPNRVDTIIVVTADPNIQEQRVMARKGMTQEKFQAILAKQVPDSEKRKRAHFVIDTSHGLESAERQVAAVIRAIEQMR